MRQKWKRRDFLRHTAMSALVAPVAYLWSDLAEAQESRKFMILVFIPNGNGANQADTFATGSGSTFEFSPTYAGLTQFKQDLIVLKRYGFKSLITDNYSGEHSAHHGGSCGMFTAAPPANNHYETPPIAPSIDQIVAWDYLKRGLINDPLRKVLPIRMTGSGFPLSTVFFQTPADYALNKVYSTAMVGASSITKPIDGFERMFGGLSIEGPDDLQDLWARGKSVLDVSAREAMTLRALLPAEGRHMLDKHISNIRELEQSLSLDQSAPPTQIPQKPADLAISAANHEKIWSQWANLMNAAIRADRTRIITVQFGGPSSRFFVPSLGLADVTDSGSGKAASDHHTYSHVDNAGTRAFIKWYNARLAELFNLLKGDADSPSLVSQGVVVVGSESGAAHNMNDIPVFLYGQGGGYFKSNQIIDLQNNPQGHTGTLLAVCKSMGLSTLNSVGLKGTKYQNGEVAALKS